MKTSEILIKARDEVANDELLHPAEAISATATTSEQVIAALAELQRACGTSVSRALQRFSVELLDTAIATAQARGD